MLFHKVEVLSPEERQNILHDALEILAQEGCSYHETEALALLAESGCEVDKEQARVRIPSAKLLSVLEQWNKTGCRSLYSHVYVAPGLTQYLWDMKEEKSYEAGIEDCRRLIGFMEKLPYIHMISCGIEPKDVPSSIRESGMAALMLEYSHKPFRISSPSHATVRDILEMAVAVAGSPEQLHQRPRCHGIIKTGQQFNYSENDIKLLQLYSHYRQPIHLVASAYSMSMPKPYILSLQLAEWLAGMYYLSCLKSLSPLILEIPSFVVGDATPHPDAVLLELATVQLAHSVHLPVGLPLHSLFSLRDFRSGWYAGIDRIFPWILDVEIRTMAGVVGQGFSIVQLFLENEIGRYLDHIKEGIALSGSSWQKIAAVGVGGSYQKSSEAALWKSEIFRYDRMELWRNYKMGMSEYTREHVERLWLETQPTSLLNDTQRQILKQIGQKQEKTVI